MQKLIVALACSSASAFVAPHASVKAVLKSDPVDEIPEVAESRYEFDANERTTRGPLVLTWHDGKRKPPTDLLEELGTSREEMPANACLFVGTEGALVANPYGEQKLYPADRYADVEIPGLSHVNHWHQWVDACLGKGSCSASFVSAQRRPIKPASSWRLTHAKPIVRGSRWRSCWPSMRKR